MKKQSNNLSEFSKVECPACGSSEVSSFSQVESFQYGDKADAVATLSATIIVHHCESCDFSFTTEDASEARHDAVCRHLKVLTPGEVRQVREQYTLSQSEFSDLSKIGKASLARWESGVLIQNQANDNLLYLLTFSDNLSRLKERALSQHEKLYEMDGNIISFKPKFKALPISEIERLQREADKFELFPESKFG